MLYSSHNSSQGRVSTNQITLTLPTFLHCLQLSPSRLDEFGSHDKMIIELFGFFPSDVPPRDDFPIKIAIRNKNTKQFIMFAPTPKHNRQVLRSTEIQGLLGTKAFTDLILKPQVRQYDLEEFLKEK